MYMYIIFNLVNSANIIPVLPIKELKLISEKLRFLLTLKLM